MVMHYQMILSVPGLNWYNPQHNEVSFLDLLVEVIPQNVSDRYCEVFVESIVLHPQEVGYSADTLDDLDDVVVVAAVEYDVAVGFVADVDARCYC